MNQNELFFDDFELSGEEPKRPKASYEPKAEQFAFIMGDGNQDVLFDDRDLVAA